MSGTKQFANLRGLARNIRNTLGTEDTADTKNYYLLFAYNGTGKTRLSVEFKNLGKRKIPGSEEKSRDTLYYNAYTEDLFYWNNDLEGDTDRRLRFNTIAIQEIIKEYQRQKTNQRSRKGGSARKPQQYHAEAEVII